MKPRDLPAEHTAGAAQDALSPLLLAPIALPTPALGELAAVASDGTRPLVRFPVGGEAAIPARSTVDLHGAQAGACVVLVFEGGDPARPIITGVLRDDRGGWPQPAPPAQVQIDADGQHMVVSARERLVLRCGQASITLTRAGKVLIEGAYVSSRSAGVNRIKGGSVQLN